MRNLKFFKVQSAKNPKIYSQNAHQVQIILDHPFFSPSRPRNYMLRHIVMTRIYECILVHRVDGSCPTPGHVIVKGVDLC